MARAFARGYCDQEGRILLLFPNRDLYPRESCFDGFVFHFPAVTKEGHHFLLKMQVLRGDVVVRSLWLFRQ